MRLWRALRDGLRTLLHRAETDRELDEELRHFLDEAEADLIAGGATREEARRQVRLQYGDALHAREDVRGYGWEAAVDTLLTDLRIGARSLRRSPAFTAVLVLTLGIGVGATTAIVSAVRPVLLDPLPYPDAERLVSVSDRGEDGGLALPTFGTYRELVERSRTLEALAAFRPWQPTLTGADEPLRLEGQSVTASYFDVLGIRPALGPGLDAAEDGPGGARQVVLSDLLWRDRFGADPDVVGRMVRLDGEPTTIVGVMPASFENVTEAHAAVWTLLQYDPLLPGFDTREWGHHLELLGRVGPGVTVETAAAELDGIARQPLEAWTRPEWASLDHGFAVRRLADAVTADVRPAMMALVGAVILLVLVTCANLTLVLLARGSRRSAEFAMRRALGSSKSRLARYLVTEGTLLALPAGALGVAAAQLGLSTLVAVAPPSLPRLATVEIDGPALLLAFGVTAVVGVLFGLAPGLHEGDASLPGMQHLRSGSRGGRRSARRSLVVVEVALATVLLVGAGLLVRSTERLFSQPIGLDAENLVVMQIHASGLPRGDGVTQRFFDEALEAVRSVPGVVAATLTSQLPLSGGSDVYGAVPDDPGAVEGVLGPAERYAVAPGYFETMGIPVIQGRAFGDRDIADAPRVAVVSRSLARRLFPDGEALGKRVCVGDPELAPFTVVGVADDVRHGSLADERAEIVYTTGAQWHWADRVRWIVVRGQADPVELVPALRDAVWSVDGNQPIVRAQTMEALVALSEARRRFVMILLSSFALSALVVSGVGLFGILSGFVAERTAELGVRAALGASSERNVSMVVRQGVSLALVGVGIGVVAAIGVSDVLTTMLFEVSRFDPLTYAAVAVLLVAASVAAAALPALRAGRVDPAEALRVE